MSDQWDQFPILGAGLNQLQGIRDALVEVLEGNAIVNRTPENIADWIREHGLQRALDVSSRRPIGCAIAEYWRESLGSLLGSVGLISSSQVNPASKDFGMNRGGTSWSEGDDFVIASAFVRALGSCEQFEVDVLKALMYYRPTGRPLGPELEREDIRVDLDVLTETPIVVDRVEYFVKPALWTWMRLPAQDKDERKKILKRVFNIEFALGETENEKKDANRNRNTWYDTRNAIAHGRAFKQVTLREYLDVDVFVTKTMFKLASECRRVQHLIV